MTRFATALLFALGLAAIAPAQQYTIEDLGSLANGSGDDYAYSGDLNNWGEATGTSLAPNQMSEHAFHWAAGTLTDLGTLGQAYSWGHSMNDAGRIAGYSGAGLTVIHAYIWKNGNMFDADLSGTSFSRADGINHFGNYAGIAHFPQPGVFPFKPIQVVGGVMSYIPTFGGDDGNAHGINDLNAVVGWSRDANGPTHPFLYEGGVLTDLGSLGGNHGRGRDINNHGLVVGWSYDVNSKMRPFAWESGAISDLGTLGGEEGMARGVNEHGQIVGYAQDANADPRAVLWDGGPPIDLNSFLPPGSGWELTGAKSINELGQILGTGQLNGVRRPFLLSPVLAEPRLSGFVPGLGGTLNTLHVIGAESGTTLWFIGGRQTGSTAVPGCSGLFAGIANPVIIGSAQADADGRAAFDFFVQNAVRGRTVLLQAVDAASCEVSEVFTQTIR